MVLSDNSSIKGKPIVWVMGPPGSGRGSQCERLYSQYNFAHLSSGQLLRDKVMNDPETYREAFKLMAEGLPVPNEIVTKVLGEGMLKAAAEESCNGFLIDGYPCDEDQCKVFEEAIGVPTIIIFLGQLNDIKLCERLKGRSNFDDSSDSIKKRLETFTNKTKPIINKYKKQINVINADRSIDDVFKEIKSVFAKFDIKECPNEYIKPSN